jgi:hypothetical protein
MGRGSWIWWLGLLNPLIRAPGFPRPGSWICGLGSWVGLSGLPVGLAIYRWQWECGVVCSLAWSRGLGVPLSPTDASGLPLQHHE